MTRFFDMFFSFWSKLLGLLDKYKFIIYGYEVSILGLLVAFIIIAFVISLFWKGAKA